MSTSFYNSLGIGSSRPILLLLIFRDCRDWLPWLCSCFSFSICKIPISLRGPTTLWRVPPDASSFWPVPELCHALCIPNSVPQILCKTFLEWTYKCKFQERGSRFLFYPVCWNGKSDILIFNLSLLFTTVSYITMQVSAWHTIGTQ